MRVILVDDEHDRTARWKRDLEALGLDLVIDVPPSLGALATQLQARRARALNSDDLGDTVEVDGADILMIDYALGEEGGGVTGRRLAYLARCYADCGTIVLMNEHGDNTFDLTLSSDFSSFADVEIGSEQLANPSLWREGGGRFRPWSWPPLLGEPQRLRAAREELSREPRRPFLDVLGIRLVADYLPKVVTDLLTEGLQSGAFDQLSLQDVQDAVNQERPGATAFGDRKDRIPASRVPSVVAARLRRWLNRLLLPSQDVLVDAPHLVSRFPSLVPGDPTSVDNWNLTTGLRLPEGPPEPLAGLAARCGPANGVWLDRPAWHWPLLQGDASIEEANDPFRPRQLPYRFCEDLSGFAEISDTRAFLSDLRPPFARRFVSRRPLDAWGGGVMYRPQSRLEG
jgi:hypothetical protein